MHDVNTKQRRIVSFSLVTLLMIKLTLHLWSKLHLEQSDGLGLEIQYVWESAKENFASSKDVPRLADIEQTEH